MCVWGGGYWPREEGMERREQYRPSPVGSRSRNFGRIKAKCLERVRASRRELLNRMRLSAGQRQGGEVQQSGGMPTTGSTKGVLAEGLRQIVRDVASKEMPTMDVTADTDAVGAHEGRGRDDDELELLLRLEKELEDDLIREEAEILAEYERQRQEAEVQDALRGHKNNFKGANTVDVMCPFCQREELQLNRSVYFCACGFRIDTGHDGISPEYFKESLLQCYTNHQQFSSTCQSRLTFAMRNEFGAPILTAGCASCGFLKIVL